MKHSLFLTILTAALLGSGVANAAGTLYPKDYTGGKIVLGSDDDYDTLAVNVPLTLTGGSGYLNLHNGATLAFSKENGAEAICSISTTEERNGNSYTVYFGAFSGEVWGYNFTFDDGAQAVVAASAGTPITLIQDLDEDCKGFRVYNEVNFQLNGKVSGETVVLNGVQFTYVGPKADGYTFQEGEIGFTGFYEGSHNLSLVANAPAVPEPTTGTLSLLALAGLCARRRRK